MFLSLFVWVSTVLDTVVHCFEVDSVVYVVLDSLGLLIPFFIFQIFYGLAFPLLSLLFTLVLFHWLGLVALD